jgi:Protein of unknown function (DUF4199)
MSNKLYLPSLVTGFGAAVLTTVPGVKEFGCCLLVPLAVITALLLFKKTSTDDQPITIKQSLLIGLFTGLFAAVFATLFDLLITFIMHSNDFVQSLPQTKQVLEGLKLGEAAKQTLDLMNSMAKQIVATGFSILYIVFIFLSNVIIDAIFGLLGGLIGRVIINRRPKT